MGRGLLHTSWSKDARRNYVEQLHLHLANGLEQDVGRGRLLLCVGVERTSARVGCSCVQALAARQRPAEKRGYDILHSIAAVNHERRRSRQDAALAAEMQVCHSVPRLNRDSHT